jgi:hypothetical protein
MVLAPNMSRSLVTDHAPGMTVPPLSYPALLAVTGIHGVCRPHRGTEMLTETSVWNC